MSALSYMADMIQPGNGGVLTLEEKLHNANVYKMHLIHSHRAEIEQLTARLGEALKRAKAAEAIAGELQYKLSQLLEDPEVARQRDAEAVRRSGRLD